MSFLLRSLLFVVFALPVLVHSAEPQVHEFTLNNGLKVLVKEDRRAPVVVSQVWYKVGSSYEYGGITGVAHMLEHMMFKGTKKHPPGEFSRIIAANGGSENAFTGRDYTAYFQSLEKSRLAVSFELEADRMRNLQLLEDEFQKERQVVLEERRMRTDDKPRAKTHEYFNAMAHTNGGYRNPVIGWADDIEHLTVADLNDWYQRYYAPNNATLVVVGDVDPNEVLTLAKKYFGPLQPSSLKSVKPRTEVEQMGPRRMTVRLPAKQPFVVLGYKVPALKNAKEEWEAYALEVLAGILDGGNSARLATHLVRGQQIAVSAGAGYDLYSRLPGLFIVEASPAPGQTVGALEQALEREIGLLQEQAVSQQELDRVKAQVLANAIYERDSVFYQAMQLGTLETVGVGWQRMDEYVERIDAVTAEQVQSVAKKYLIDNRLSVAVLDPLPMTNKQPAQAQPGGRHAH